MFMACFLHQKKTYYKGFHGPIWIPTYKNYGQWASTILEQKQERHFDKFGDLGLVSLWTINNGTNS